MRNILAVVVGFVVGSAVNMAQVTMGPQIIPPPAGVDMRNMESIRASAHLFEAKARNVARTGWALRAWWSDREQFTGHRRAM